ncbi:MAG: AMP-binding protein [Janthinobacterium lividum]
MESTEQQTDSLRALWDKAWPASLPRGSYYPHGEIPLSEYLRAWARVQADQPALIFYGHVLSFAQLDRASDQFAALLAQHGIGIGDRVSVMMPNCPQFNIAFYGILKRGAIYAPLSPMSTAYEARHQLIDSQASAIVVLDALMPVVREVKSDSALRVVFVTSFEEVLPARPALPIPDMLRAPRVACADAIDLLPALRAITAPPPMPVPTLDAPAALNYTGGTTGLPKGCIHTQGDMIYTAASNYHVGGLDPNGMVVSFWPQFWIAGENIGMIHPMFAGAGVVLMARWDALAFMQAVHQHRGTFVAMPMDSAIEVMEHPRVGEFDLTSLRRCRAVSFVKKLNADYRRRWQALTGTTLLSAPFGMTETHTNDTFTVGMDIDDFDLKARPVFVGLPVPGTEFKICDFETGERLALGAEGEICVRSPSLAKGYWNNAEASARMLRDGWLHTGDIGLLDAAGYLHYLGRRKEMLKVKGMSVFPSELEAMLVRHPGVQSCAVVGREDGERGQLPVAFVVADPDAPAALDQAALATWCREVMASYKVPEIRVVDAFPLTGTGKVRKDELLRWAEAGR